MANEKDQDLTPISKLGEFGFIDHVTRDFEPENARVLKGVGDDAAVYEVSKSEVHLVTTDLLAEGVHFDLRYVPLQHLGYKAVVVNLSDIFAMNGEPFAITVSIAMSSRFTVEAMDALYDGIRHACKTYNVDLIGGDTSSCHAGLVISITALGQANKEDVAYRSGARENDLICVTGNVGAAYAGLQILEREKSVFLQNPEIQPELGGYEYVVERQLKPELPVAVLRELRNSGVRPTSMIDISDGLGSDLLHLCTSSRTGATIYETKLMIDPQVQKVSEELSIAVLTMALNGGEDYELLFTVPLEDYDKVKAIGGLTIIGHMTEELAGVNVVTAGGVVLPVEAQGWKHFGGESKE